MLCKRLYLSAFGLCEQFFIFTKFARNEESVFSCDM